MCTSPVLYCAVRYSDDDNCCRQSCKHVVVSASRISSWQECVCLSGWVCNVYVCVRERESALVLNRKPNTVNDVYWSRGQSQQRFRPLTGRSYKVPCHERFRNWMYLCCRVMSSSASSSSASAKLTTLMPLCVTRNNTKIYTSVGIHILYFMYAKGMRNMNRYVIKLALTEWVFSP